MAFAMNHVSPEAGLGCVSGPGSPSVHSGGDYTLFPLLETIAEETTDELLLDMTSGSSRSGSCSSVSGSASYSSSSGRWNWGWGWLTDDDSSSVRHLSPERIDTILKPKAQPQCARSKVVHPPPGIFLFISSIFIVKLYN